MPRPSSSTHRRLGTGHIGPTPTQTLPARDAFRAVGRGLMGGLVGILIDVLWPARPEEDAGRH